MRVVLYAVVSVEADIDNEEELASLKEGFQDTPVGMHLINPVEVLSTYDV